MFVSIFKEVNFLFKWWSQNWIYIIDFDIFNCSKYFQFPIRKKKMVPSETLEKAYWVAPISLVHISFFLFSDFFHLIWSFIFIQCNHSFTFFAVEHFLLHVSPCITCVSLHWSRLGLPTYTFSLHYIEQLTHLHFRSCIKCCAIFLGLKLTYLSLWINFVRRFLKTYDIVYKLFSDYFISYENNLYYTKTI